jgi:hypothetical protein
MRTFFISLAWILTALAPVTRGEDASSEKYDLRYKFNKGEEVRWLTVHQGAWTTKIKGHEQKSLSTSKSTKVWKVTDVNAEGHITLVHTIDDVDMWRQVGDRAEERYNSKTDTTAPAGYEMVAATVGETITEAVIDAHGAVIQREDKFPKFNASVGDLVIPLPENPVAVGEEWFVPDEVKVPTQGAVKLIKLRKAFKLEKVATGVATISVTTQVLTPVNEPRVEAQLMQHVTKGVVKFDVEAGRVISRRLDWNETVLGFEGADSSMTYLARFTEELATGEPRTAGKPETPAK